MRYWILGAALCSVTLSGEAQARAPRFEASITRTTHGIPHVTANNWRGIGYGVAYAYAQDNLCMLAEEFVTVAGERSLHFGPNEKSSIGFEPVENIASDVFFRATIDAAQLRRGMARGATPANQLRAGYVAGYNRLLRDLGPTNVPAACRGKAWVRPITIDDMLRLGEKQALLAGSLALAPAVAGAAPPNTARAAQAASLDLPAPHETGIGSNGWAFGAETTANGRGVLVGNPHFPWNGPSRFYQMHITIPGVVDVMGAAIAGAPLPTIGFNRDMAWTHTVTAARHFTLFELKLDPTDATSYLIDGKIEKMVTKTVNVPMPNGDAPISRTLYTTRFGPVLAMPAAGMAWSATTAFALRDANSGNQRLLDTWVAIGQARSVGEVRNAVEMTLGIPWVNTIAADRNGDALLADVTAVPNVSTQKIAACATPRSAPMAARIILLDGSKASCNWDVAAGTPVAGLMPARDQAVFVRRDYVANSNDSYWLTNPAAPAQPLSPILGGARTERSLRTRSGLIEINRRLTAADGWPDSNKVDQELAREMVFANKSLAVELTLDKVLALCVGQADLTRACDVLGKWDGRFDVDSRGAYLFVAFWDGAMAIPGKWAMPFDVNDPVHTPRDLITTGEVGAKLLAALRAGVAKLAAENIALDARWGDVQFAVRGQERIPVHGAHGNLGVLNVQMSDKVTGGIVPRHGSSYIQVVSFDEVGPIADAILSYSQSTDPASPYFADQTRDYGTKTWNRLPFTAVQIAAARVGDEVKLRD
jgi:acyl-homoserine-lactone acylase